MKNLNYKKLLRIIIMKKYNDQKKKKTKSIKVTTPWYMSPQLIRRDTPMVCLLATFHYFRFFF